MVSCSIIIPFSLALWIFGSYIRIFCYFYHNYNRFPFFSFAYPRIIAQTGMDIRESRVEITIHLVAKV